MDLTTALTADETAALSTYTHLDMCHAGGHFDSLCRERLRLDPSGYEHYFDTCLRIKNTLDAVERSAPSADMRHELAVMLNCEFLIWCYYAIYPLRQNPFLSHWVEALQRLGTADMYGKDARTAQGEVSPDAFKLVRVLFIQTILEGREITHWGDWSPEKVTSELLSGDFEESFDLQPYIRMLQDEGIYEKTPESEARAAPNAPPRDEHIEPSPEESLQNQKDDILRNLQQDPQTAIFDITRLPITLAHLDFLTTLLTSHTLESHAIDPAPVITQYIQHALRTVERMDKPPSDMAAERAQSDGEVLEYGKEAQSRCILLLLLFIKSLIRKQVVELEVLFYEIAEITVRYVWVKEVREFRTWVEEGREVGVGFGS